MKSIFYWPGLKAAVEKYVKDCDVCQMRKTDNQGKPNLLQPLPVPTQCWSHVSMDFIEGLPKSNGKDTILVVVDRLTKYAHFSYPYLTRSMLAN